MSDQIRDKSYFVLPFPGSLKQAHSIICFFPNLSKDLSFTYSTKPLAFMGNSEKGQCLKCHQLAAAAAGPSAA